MLRALGRGALRTEGVRHGIASVQIARTNRLDFGRDRWYRPQICSGFIARCVPAMGARIAAMAGDSRVVDGGGWEVNMASPCTFTPCLGVGDKGEALAVNRGAR